LDPFWFKLIESALIKTFSSLNLRVLTFLIWPFDVAIYFVAVINIKNLPTKSRHPLITLFNGLPVEPNNKLLEFEVGIVKLMVSFFV